MTYFHAELRKLLSLPSLRLTVVLTWAGTALMTLTPADPVCYARAGFLALGVLAAASEHQAGGQIRATLLAMPRRLPLQAAKAFTLAAVTVPIAAADALLAGEPAATAVLTLSTLLGSAVATLIRHALPALSVLLGWHFIADPLLHGGYPDAARLGPGNGVAATAVWTACGLIIAAVTFRHRDA